jgi:hypothetical protein
MNAMTTPAAPPPPEPATRKTIGGWLGQYSKAIAAAVGLAITIATAVYAGKATPHWVLLLEAVATAAGVWVAPNTRL